MEEHLQHKRRSFSCLLIMYFFHCGIYLEGFDGNTSKINNIRGSDEEYEFFFSHNSTLTSICTCANWKIWNSLETLIIMWKLVGEI